MAETEYLLAVHHAYGEPDPPEAEMQAAYAAVDEFNARLQAKGAWVFAGGLCPPETATVVSAASGEVMTTDGPYAESREHLGGFWVIRAADLDEALAWAREATVACRGPVEVRPFQSDDSSDDSE